MTLRTRSHLNFLIYEENLVFFFISESTVMFYVISSLIGIFDKFTFVVKREAQAEVQLAFKCKESTCE
jgi:hypothetical protein